VKINLLIVLRSKYFLYVYSRQLSRYFSSQYIYIILYNGSRIMLYTTDLKKTQIRIYKNNKCINNVQNTFSSNIDVSVRCIYIFFTCLYSYFWKEKQKHIKILFNIIKTVYMQKSLVQISGNAYPSGAPDFTSGFHRGSCCPVICVFYFILYSCLFYFEFCCTFSLIAWYFLLLWNVNDLSCLFTLVHII